LARTYARAIAGKPLSMAFDSSSARFHLNYTAFDVITEDEVFTEVFLHNGFYYPAGFDVVIDPSEGTEWGVLQQGSTDDDNEATDGETSPSFSVIGVRVTDPALAGATITVTIQPHSETNLE